MRDILLKYEFDSGQAINFQKSGIMFSSNIRIDKQQELARVLGVHSPLNTGRYLGLPSLIGKSKKAIFNFLKEKLWKRLQGWNKKFLSRAGKEVLIKTVAQAIPTYCMSSFLLPKSLCDDL